MHGLINRAIQRFVTDSYGVANWHTTAARAGLNFTDFEVMWTYDEGITPKVLEAACDVLDRTYDELLEDIGTYLVSHQNTQSLRRLLRFGGVTFVEFLHSLEDLPDRARLAVKDLALPRIELEEHSSQQYSLRCYSDMYGWGFAIMGVLRALADDYGALVFLEHTGQSGGCETLAISLLEAEFSVGREFDLAIGRA